MKTNEISYIDTFNYKKLRDITRISSGSSFVPESASVLLTNSSSTINRFIYEIELHNTNTLLSTGVRLFLNPSGSVTSSVNTQILYVTVAPLETVWVENKCPYIIANGDTLSGISNVSAVNILFKGNEGSV